MKLNNSIRKYLAVAAMAVVAGVWGACSADEADTPSAPSAPTVPSAPTTGTYNVSVSVSPNALTLPADGSAEPIPTSTVTFTVRRQSDNSLAPSGLILVATASNGTLSAPLCTGSTLQYCIPLNNGQAITTFTPTSEGTATITASVDGAASAQATVNVVEQDGSASFLLSHITPSVVDPAGGQTVTIFGSNILSPVRVLIDGTQAQVLSSNSSSITVRVPPANGSVPVGTTRPVTVQVTSGVGTEFESTDTLSNGIIYAHGGSVTQPNVFSVTPTTGPHEGKTRLVINGNGFLSPVQVIFRFAARSGSLDLEGRVVNVSSTQITVESPDIRTFVASDELADPISALVRVINLNNGFAADASQRFFYGSANRLTSVSPGEGLSTGGDRVVITGNGFDEPLTVTIGGIGQQVVSVTGTQIVIRTVGLNNAACGIRTTQPVVVTMIEGGATATGVNFTYVGPPNPRIFGVSPPTANIGATVSILGESFDSPVRVLFGGADGSAATVLSTSATSISVNVPTPPPGFTFSTEACDGNNDGIPSGVRDIPTRISVNVTNLDTACTATLSNAFTVNPPSTTCRNDNSTPPPPPTVQCTDTFDNDSDGFIDAADPQCTGPTDNNEAA
jgi:hypothetical protein